MFLKPFKIKSQTTLKKSDRKKFIGSLKVQLKNCRLDLISELFPQKEEISSTKILTHTEENVLIYSLKKNPLFFELQGILYPSVYCLWKHYELCDVYFKTHEEVFKRLSNGADLMLPGVIQPLDGWSNIPSFLVNHVCAVALKGNRSAIAVGYTGLSSQQISNNIVQKGKAAILLHTYQDLLWAMGDKSEPPYIQEIHQNSIFDTANCSIADEQLVSRSSSDSLINSSSIKTHTNSELEDINLDTKLKTDLFQDIKTDINSVDESLTNSEWVNNIINISELRINKKVEEFGSEIKNDFKLNNDDDNDEEINSIFKIETGRKVKFLENEVESLKRRSSSSDELQIVCDFKLGLNDEQKLGPDEQDTMKMGRVDYHEKSNVVFETPDELFDSCFLYCLKKYGRHLALPMLTNVFYKNYFMPCCPEGHRLEIKSTTHKKLSNFLRSKKMDGYLEVDCLVKGVESITKINLENPGLRSFKLPDWELNEQYQLRTEHSVEDMNYQAPEITTVYIVSNQVMPLMNSLKVSKGSVLTSTEIRNLVTKYIKDSNLQNGRNVELNEVLSKSLLNNKEYCLSLTWNDLFERLLNKMTAAHKIQFPGKQPIVKKGQPQKIKMDVKIKAANKKVTMVENLDYYNIDIDQLANRIQKNISCSASVQSNPFEGNKSRILVVQGNQIEYIKNLLSETYKLSIAYMEGLDKAVKNKNKK